MTAEDFKRKLTAILSADVVGYSRLMGEDEAATVKTLETYKGVMSSLIRQHRGRVVDSPGDNLLAEFGSVVDAVQCAVSIQKELQTRNADLAENRRMEFRIGINLGDVIEEEDRIYGDGVNIAARLEALADPGGICISKMAFDYIENKLPFGYKFIGEQTVKNIAKPIGAYKVLMETRVVDANTKREAKAVSFWRRKAILSLGIIVTLAIFAVLYWNFNLRETSIGPASIEPEQVPALVEEEEAANTIAVLPFVNLSFDPEQEYFVDGLSEEILNSLAQIPDLTVIARTSSFSFKGTNKTIQEIASVLGVDNILEGSVRKAGNALRITAQLVKTVDGSHLWSKTYDRELKDIFVVQEDIATTVANELKATLGIGKSLKQVGGTDNPEAYELYLVARGQYTDKTELALKSVEAALELDPKYALAWEFKSECHNSISFQASPELVASVRDAGLRAAQKAIELEPNLASGYVSLAFSESVSGNFIEAGLTYRKAFEMATYQSADPNRCSVTHYLTVGYIKKIKEILEEARKSDPLNKGIRAWYITILACLDDIQMAEKEYERGKAMFLNNWFVGDIFIYQARIATGNLQSSDTTMSWEVTNVAKKHLDSPKDGLADLHRLYNGKKNLDASTLTEFSQWAAYFGDPDFALDTIVKASKYNAEVISYLWVPVMHEVRQAPRFKKFVREIGLVDYWNKFGWPDICRPLDNGDFECD